MSLHHLARILPSAVLRHGGGPSAPALRVSSALRLHLRALSATADDFHATEEATFGTLGLDARVCAGLAAAGFARPAQVQQLAATEILSGRNIVLAAETGSGKTLAYLAPLASAILANRDGAAALEAARALRDDYSDLLGYKSPEAALVLCPNVALCQQVAAVASAAFRDPDTGDRLVTAAVVASGSPPPRLLPDFIITTPGALATAIDSGAFDAKWTREGLAQWVRHVVLDEADLLLSGGYSRHLNIIMDQLHTGDRERKAKRAAGEVGITVEEYRALPRLLRKAAQAGGGAAMVKAGFSPPGPPVPAEDLPWLRQYVFVAATMPAEGDHTVGAEIAESFPDAVWLAGEPLHRARRSVTHAWRQFSEEWERDEALAVS